MLSGFTPRPLKRHNPDCHHVKYLTNSCGSRACPSCGKKATDLWIATQLNRFPDCDWVHLVFTLPDTLWPVFESNRWLLNNVCRLAVENLLYAARKRGLEPGIFCAIHTYGRRLNWHPHVHVSVTCGGLNKHGQVKGRAGPQHRFVDDVTVLPNFHVL